MKEVAQFFKILSDEARLQILWLLFNHDEVCVCDIMDALGTTQSKTSRHLANLRHAGLVIDRKEGAWSYYSIRQPKSDLERAVLDTLRLKLAKHASAAKILRDLNARIQLREREAK